MTHPSPLIPTSSRERALLAVAHRLGVAVVTAPMGGTRRGAYIHRARTIVLRDGLTDAQRAAALAHEVVHARRGDDGPQTPAVEARVDEDAAAMLIPTAAYARAEALVGPDPRALAVELETTPATVAAWQRHRARTARYALTT